MNIPELIRSGYAGVLPNGNIVDRREHPNAVPMAANSMMGVPEPKNVNEFDKQVHEFLRDGFIEAKGSSAWSNDRNRPYDGQPHTDYGKRGRTEVRGLTMRDLCDCFAMGALRAAACDQPDLGERVESGAWVIDDVGKIDWSKIAPLAVMQCMMCEVEKMMGIFPNVPRPDNQEPTE